VAPCLPQHARPVLGRRTRPMSTRVAGRASTWSRPPWWWLRTSRRWL